jgi:transcription initiation factor TFIIH subunit 2
VCPRCSSRVEELPSQCSVCKLTLVSSPHLARSYHHLFPVPPFLEGACSNGNGAGGLPTPKAVQCFSCQRRVAGGANVTSSDDETASVCETCKQSFCFSCDIYIHEKLHNCPGCENSTANTTAV